MYFQKIGNKLILDSFVHNFNATEIILRYKPALPQIESLRFGYFFETARSRQ